MNALPALLHAIAFAITLFVQFWGSPLAGAWLFFHLAGCAVLLYSGSYPREQRTAWYAVLVWLLTIGTSTFLFTPVQNGAAIMWILAAMPSLALCLRKEHLRPYCICFGAVITLYALGLGAQLVLNTETTAYNYPGRHAWPLLDPNNAAAVVNLGLVPCVWLALFKDLRWSALCLVFAFALCATGSKAGFAAAGLATVILLAARLGTEFLIFASFIGALFAGAIFFYRPELILIVLDSFRDRFPIWDASLPLALVRPLAGIGLGAFGHYYEQVRTEEYTVGWHCHNDVLQFAIEMGIPAAFTFCAMVVAAALATCRANLAAACALMAVVLQSTVEFQFYIPAVSLPLGLALGFLLLNQPRKAAL